MEINWQEVPSDTIRATTRGAIEVVEPVTELEAPVSPEETVRLYVVFTKSDSATLEQQAEALAETVDMSVRMYDETGHAAVIQTTALFIPKIKKSPEVAELRLELEAELTGSMKTEKEELASALASAEAADSSESPKQTGKEEASEESEPVAEEQAVSDTEPGQTVQIAEDDSEKDTQGISAEAGEQTAYVTQAVDVPVPVKRGNTATPVVFTVLGCLILAVAAVLILRRR